MITRALIVAIEHYPESTATSQALPGTIEAAERFARWLQTELAVQKEDIVFCASGQSDYRTHGTATQEVKRAILDLIRAGHNQTDSLMVYLAGHGVMLPQRVSDSDLLLCSDFVEPQISGSNCIELSELTKLLATSLGIGNHFYFVDACRSEVEDFDPTRLGITPFAATSGTADSYQLLSGRPFEAVPSDSLFVDSLLDALGTSAQELEGGRISFQTVAESVASAFEQQQRKIFVRLSGGTDGLIRKPLSGSAPTILDEVGTKIPPVQLLIDFDEVAFLGQTNGQLPDHLRQAFQIRSYLNKGRWSKLQVLSIEDLANAFRNGVSIDQLNAEREQCEAFFRNEATTMADSIELYRYRYIGTFGSLWRSRTGKRRAHLSAGLPGVDIRVSPAEDFVDFPGSPHPAIDRGFDLVERAIESDDCQLLFRHP